MFFRDYFSSCGFLVQSRKNVRSDFFSFFFLRGCLRASTRLTVTENAWGFSAGPTAPMQERTRNRITFLQYIATRKTRRRHRRVVVAVIIGLLYVADFAHT